MFLNRQLILGVLLLSGVVAALLLRTRRRRLHRRQMGDDPALINAFVLVSPAEADVSEKNANLREAYKHLYDQNHYLRELLYKIVTAAIGLMGVADGWLITKTSYTSVTTRLAVSLADASISDLALYAIQTHYREFVANAAMIVRVERALGLYWPGHFVQGESLYAAESSKWGWGVYSRHIVRSYFVAVATIGGFSLVLCWIVSPLPPPQRPENLLRPVSVDSGAKCLHLNTPGQETRDAQECSWIWCQIADALTDDPKWNTDLASKINK